MAKHNRHDVVVLMAPLHGVSASKAELLRARQIKNKDGHTADIVIHSEGSSPKKKGFFKDMSRWKHFTGPLKKPDPRGRIAPWDCIILVKKHFKTVVKWSQKAANASEPLKIAPERWIVEWEGFVRWILVRVITEHPHAGIHVPINTDREREYVKQAEIFRHRIQSALSQNTPTIAGGDLNYGESDRERWMPKSIFDDLNMNYVVEDVTWLAWSHHFEKVDVEVIPPARNGQDHNWIMLTLRRR